mmetsp:Transcript_53783/g.99419  ORF Transcript_53783/g.99419 Transcript_53783/m.99419 type:complete len:270 (+) Transcript_53783:69-878(+)
MEQGSGGRLVTNAINFAVEGSRQAFGSSNYAAVPSAPPAAAAAQPRRELVDESSIEALWWSHDDAPGLYKIISDKVAVSTTLNLGGPILTELRIGTLVKVAELSNCPGRLRGLLEEDGDVPKGWISIQNLHSDRRWAMRLVVPTQVPLLSFDGNARNMRGLQSCCSATKEIATKIVDTEEATEDARPEQEVAVSQIDFDNHGSCWQPRRDAHGNIRVVMSAAEDQQLGRLPRAFEQPSVMTMERSYPEPSSQTTSCSDQLLQPVKMFTI